MCSEKSVWTSGFWWKCQNDKFYLSLSLVNAFWMPCPLSGKHNTQLSAGYPVDFQRIYCRFPGDIQWTFSRYPDIGFCALNPYWVLKVRLSRIFLPRKAVPYSVPSKFKVQWLFCRVLISALPSVFLQGVQETLCFFTIHCNPSLAYIAVRDLQSSQRNASVQSLPLAGNFLYNQ